MRKLILVAHVSLDGFVSGLNGELDGFEAGQENLEFVCRLTDGADAALFGRVSYQLLDSYWPNARHLPNVTKSEIDYSNWYNTATKIVLSKTMTQASVNSVTIINDSIFEEINKIKQQPGKNILIFGSPKAFQSLLKLDLVDDCWIFINPVIFGNGIPLFASSNDKTKLKLLSTKQFTNGEIALNYTVGHSLTNF